MKRNIHMPLTGEVAKLPQQSAQDCFQRLSDHFNSEKRRIHYNMRLDDDQKARMIAERDSLLRDLNYLKYGR